MTNLSSDVTAATGFIAKAKAWISAHAVLAVIAALAAGFLVGKIV